MNIYVGNLEYSCTEDELKTAFEAYGEVSSVKIIIDRETGRAKGFGFVEMENGGDEAINGLNGSELRGRPLKVNEARPQQPRQNRGFGGGGGGWR